LDILHASVEEASLLYTCVESAAAVPCALGRWHCSCQCHWHKLSAAPAVSRLYQMAEPASNDFWRTSSDENGYDDMGRSKKIK
jgi:hypothetical protein